MRSRVRADRDGGAAAALPDGGLVAMQKCYTVLATAPNSTFSTNNGLQARPRATKRSNSWTASDKSVVNALTCACFGSR